MSKKKIREDFRNKVFKRDGSLCKVCKIACDKIDAHHITDRNEMPNGGYILENGITLCDKENGCHIKAEQYHLGNKVEPGYSPDELYKLINSSFELAFLKSS